MADNIAAIAIGNPLSLVSGTLNIDYTTGALLPGTAIDLDLGGTQTPLANLAVTTDPNGMATTITGVNAAGVNVALQYQGVLPSNVTASATAAGIPLATTSVTASSAVVCFGTGTAITTVRGDVAVEDLRVGDLVVTASGGRRPVRWIGHRTMRPADHAEPWNVHPVRVSVGAFGEGLPRRALRLSPGHPVLVDADVDGHGGYLVPIMCLINGTTIGRETVETVTYWHVELDRHDVLLAEGLPAESFLDYGNRSWFGSASDTHTLGDPDFVAPGLAGRCRPVATDGPTVEAERRRLDGVLTARLANMCAWPNEMEDAAI